MLPSPHLPLPSLRGSLDSGTPALPGGGAEPLTSFAQAVRSSASFQKGGLTTPAPSPPHSPIWYEPWDPSLQPAPHAAHAAQLLLPSPSHPPPQLMATTPLYQMPTSWQSYLQAIPTKEDFKQLIEDVKSTCRTEIQALPTDHKHLADRVEVAEEEIQETKLAVHRTQLQGGDHRLLLRDM